MGVLLPEWSPRRALVVRWPWRPDIWPHAGRDAQHELLQLLRLLAPPLAERGIRIELEAPEIEHGAIAPMLPPSVALIASDYADIWIRDCAPFYVSDHALLTGFNGWAGLDNCFANDLQARQALCQRFALSTMSIDIVLEGGSLHTNGTGLVVYVETAVLDPRRNPDLTQAAFHQHLTQRFNATSIVPLAAGLQSDETGGHTDNLLTFLTPQHALVSVPDSPQHPDYEHAQHCVSLLQAQGIKVLALPQPELVLTAEEAAAIEPRQGVKARHAGMPLTASYANGIRLADIYVVPQFGVAEDAAVVSAIQRWCPQLTVLCAPARRVLVGGGGWHCASHAVV